MADVEVGDERDDAGTEGAAGGHVGGRPGGDQRAAAGAGAAMQPHPRRHRPDRRQVDVVIGAQARLVGRRQRLAAAGAGRDEHIARLVGIVAEPAGDAGPAAARRLADASRPVRLGALRRRQRGVVGRLGRRAEPRFERRDARFQRGVAGFERSVAGFERSVALQQCQHQRHQLPPAQRINRLGIHPKLESAPHKPVKPPHTHAGQRVQVNGV